MGLWNVIAAAAVAWIAGVLWYRRFALHRTVGAPVTQERLPLLAGVAFVVLVLVAGFLRHIFFVSGLTSNLGLGFVAGMGIGLFFIAPWLCLMNLADGRPLRIALIDGGYATLATALMGALLIAF